MNTTTTLDPGTLIDADTIRHRADRLSRAALVAITADVDLTAAVTVHHLERAGVTDRDLETLLATEMSDGCGELPAEESEVP